MKHQRTFQTFAAAAGLLVLIFDGKTAVTGAKNGIDLCVKTLIPSLFPFLVLTTVITSNSGQIRSPGLLRLIRRLGIPSGASDILVPAFLGGYPIGAKSAGELYGSSRITKYEAERLLAFCSNAGPSFLFGMVAAFFSDQRAVFCLWLIHITGAVLTALTLPSDMAQTDTRSTSDTTRKTDIMLSSVKAMAVICGWVILFRICAAFLRAWLLWRFPDWLQVLLIGMLELSNGCCELLRIQDESIRFIVCSCMLASGGICVLLQTVSVANGLSIRYYIRGKILQTLFCLFLSCAATTGTPIPYGAAVFLLFVSVRKIENKSGNPLTFPV